jgi:hypothetical protein
MMRQIILPVSDLYRQAICRAILLQVVAALVLLDLLDGGFTARIGGYAMVGFWAGVAIIILRRPQIPQASDLKYIRSGYLLALGIGIVAAMIVTTLRGSEWGG